MHIYKQKLNGEVHPCEFCGKVGENVQHHVGGRRYDDRAIWVCWECHARIHANPSWAYQNNLLIRRDKTTMKAKKVKVCGHTKTINDFSTGKLVVRCLFCKKEVGEARHGTKHKTEASRATTAPKMGYEKQDPRLVEAENLKRKYVALKRKVNKGWGTPEELKVLKSEMEETYRQMKLLEKSFQE